MSAKSKAKLFLKSFVGISELKDNELWKLVISGNKDAFSMVYEKYKTPIYSFCLTMVKNQSKAEELMQECFLKAYKSKDQFSDSYELKNWLYAIARNTTLDSLKRKDALNFTMDIKNQDGESMGVEELTFHDDGPEAKVLAKVDHEQVHHCIGGLGDRQKMAIGLNMFSGLAYEEIAENMDTTVSSVKSLLNRAKKALMACLSTFINEEPEVSS